MSNPYAQFVKANFAKVKASLGPGAKLGDVSKALAAIWSQSNTVVRKAKKSPRSRKCTKKFNAKCAAKGKVCHVNKKRRSCRKA